VCNMVACIWILALTNLVQCFRILVIDLVWQYNPFYKFYMLPYMRLHDFNEIMANLGQMKKKRKLKERPQHPLLIQRHPKPRLMKKTNILVKIFISTFTPV